MAIGRGRLERKILEKSPRKGRKKVSKKKTSKKDIESKISKLFGGTGGGRGEPKELPESINVPGVGEIKPPRQKRKTKAKKTDAKPDIGRPKKVKGGKKRPVKIRVTEAKPKVREDIQIDIPEIINIPGIGQIEVPKAKPKAKPKPKKEVKTPKKGRIREREDIRVDTPTREDIDKIIKDLDIKIPKVIDIPGMGQVTIPTAPKPPVDTATELPKFPKPGDPDIDLRLGIPGESGRGGINPGMGVYRPDGTEYRLADPDFDYQAMARGEYLTEKPAPTPPSGVGREPAPDLPPAPTAPIRVDTTPEPAPPPPPQFIDMDPLKGMRETIIPRNILGQSFDPSVRDDYEKQMQAARAAMMQPGGNIRATEYPTYQTPTLAVPQTQFGGYGQPMPVAPLLPYAGLASATMPEQITQQREPASGARVNPGTGQIEPIGVAPDPGLVNLPPGVSGPIR